MKIALAFTGLILSCACPATGQEAGPNGFELTDLRVPAEEILSGGPPPDGIPSIDEPKFIAPEEADYMADEDVVLSFRQGDVARAYPLRILVWHEIVNETIDGRPILVTYCPLCGTAMIFDRKIGGKVRSFGVSGLLYNSDVLMFDRETESLWSQLKMEAISGPESGTELELLNSEQMTWKAWTGKYPDGRVLSTETGHRRNYDGSAYAAYFDSPNVAFPVPEHRDELPRKSWVIGVVHDGKAMAFPVEELERHGRAKLGGVRLSFDSDTRLAEAKDAEGNEIPSVTVFWFAWQAFHPDTGLWKP